MRAKRKKAKTLTFDGADKCFVCESINATGLKHLVHPAAPWAVCERCRYVTPADFIQEKDPEKKKRIAVVLGAPLLAFFIKAKLPELFGGSQRPKRR